MKKIILFKPVSHIQIGHLYEHIYCSVLTKTMRNKGLFAYVDFDLEAKTYYAGAIYLELHLYSPAAEEKESLISDLLIGIDENTVKNAILQITAEKSADTHGLDIKYIAQQLEALHAMPWQRLETTGIINLNKQRKTAKGLVLKPRSQKQFKILRQTIEANRAYIHQDKNVRLPLFIALSKMLRINLQDIIADTSYGYTYDDYFTVSNTAKDTNLYNIDKRSDLSIDECGVQAKALAKEMVRYGAFKRLSKFLQNTSTTDPYAAPDIEEILGKSGVIVGDKGWRYIGTEQNIRELLQQITISFRYGKDTCRIKLSDQI